MHPTRTLTIALLAIACGDESRFPHAVATPPNPSASRPTTGAPTSHDDPIECANTHAAAEAAACYEDNACYVISRCMEGCATERCAAECVEGLHLLEGRRRFRDWVVAFSSACVDLPLPGFVRPDQTQCMREHCAPQLDACFRDNPTCTTIYQRAARCFDYAEHGLIQFVGHRDCVADSIDDFLEFSDLPPITTREDELRDVEALQACMFERCGVGRWTSSR